MREILATLEERLRPVAGSGARTEAELVLSHLTGKRRLELYLDGSPVDEDALAPALEEAVAKRLKGMPLQYAVGRAYFWDFELAVDPRVLIPRDETELLVEVTLAGLPPGFPLVIEVGVGSGAVSIALARETAALVIGTDISPEACELARWNVRSLGLERRVLVYEGDCFRPLEGMRLEGLAAAVVSNPPYVASGEMDSLPPETRWEPRVALDGGEDGLDVARRVVAGAAAFLRRGGLLALEVGWNQAGRIAAAMAKAGVYGDICVHKDLSGVERVVTGRRV